MKFRLASRRGDPLQIVPQRSGETGDNGPTQNVSTRTKTRYRTSVLYAAAVEGAMRVGTSTTTGRGSFLRPRDEILSDDENRKTTLEMRAGYRL